MSTEDLAVVSLHLQNFTLDPQGAIGDNGSARHAREQNLVENVATLFAAARSRDVPIFHIACGFDEAYTGINPYMPIFTGLQQRGEMKIGSWGVEFFPAIKPEAVDTTIYHAGLSPFAGTTLDKILTGRRIRRLLVFGISTRWVVEAAVFDACDRGYGVTVVSDCSAAADEGLQREAVVALRNFATVADTRTVVSTVLAG